MKTALALLIGLLIGAACRSFDLPAPAPNRLIGALLICSVTIGYIAVDWALERQSATPDAQVADGPDSTGQR
ncbi:MAG: DUF1427 family protein [Acidobacteriota bacterium]